LRKTRRPNEKRGRERPGLGIEEWDIMDEMDKNGEWVGAGAGGVLTEREAETYLYILFI
jgi:hypothetical protein